MMALPEAGAEPRAVSPSMVAFEPLRSIAFCASTSNLKFPSAMAVSA
jgi:hypothetical protein